MPRGTRVENVRLIRNLVDRHGTCRWVADISTKATTLNRQHLGCRYIAREIGLDYGEP